ncbi:UDP-GlcNAc:betaGal beta-1,3-N-acetylglucosaminyltransferase-like protein 1 isoform X4 [Pteropus vampyrus]|uniref:UDP-GlcNAc:betaGal beta-1,3-N-acetylglucosaminyltransferase-like protein 1 isoform X4 n=1 Tax=Pteropus vampyrus TaxID=132908 RepID=A0A6P6D4D9_PTEVA|nr:UDP-GlcNAc:betaGal beta-1,3-N-acetylglucosaminyltransferase-like protein 1 isoform X4 [Pteropus vampyrus]
MSKCPHTFLLRILPSLHRSRDLLLDLCQKWAGHACGACSWTQFCPVGLRVCHSVTLLCRGCCSCRAFTSHGPTVIMPTWFCSRAWFSHVGLFDEGGQGVPEDLLFFYDHLRKGGGVVRVDQSLLLYRYHPRAATHSILETTIWSHRVRFLEEWALPRWATFTIWNAGRQGRRLYRSLTPGARAKVVAFCDVDENKIKKGFYCYEDSKERPKPRVPIVHFRDARPPFVICVKLDLTGGAFEDNLQSLNLREGRDFLHFS